MFYFFAIVAAIVLSVFLYLRKTVPDSDRDKKHSESSRYKPKSRHLPILLLEYKRYIIAQQTTVECIMRMLKEMASLARKESPEELEAMANPGEYEIRHFGFAKQGEWLILKIDPTTEFYFYHNLVAWFEGCDSGLDCPDKVVGVARHAERPELDYVFFLDPANGYGDTVVGAFREGPPFSVYLPEAYDDEGNMKSKPNLILTYDRVMRPYRADGVDELKFESLHYDMEPVRWY